MDGFIEDRAGSLEWSVPDEEVHRHFNALERETVHHLCGRKLYEIMKFWQTAEQTQSLHDYELEFARLYNAKANTVFSKTLTSVLPGDTLLREISAEVIQNLKKLPGKYISVGGAEVARTLLALHLIDEIRLYITPIILGGGKPMFLAQEHKFPMQLINTQTFKSGIVLLTYQKQAE